jgi:hypothetical protein
VKKFVLDFDFTSITWKNYKDFKNVRNDLIHPKQNDDDLAIIHYQKHVKNGLKSVIEIMNSISYGVFKKELRKQLLDLIPE